MLRGLSKNVQLITLGWVLMSTGFAATMPFLAIYLVDVRSVSYEVTGALFLFQGLVGLLSQVLAGFVSDWIGPRWTMQAGNVAAVGSTFALAYMIAADADPFLIMAAYLIFSFLRGLAMPASSALVADDKGDVVTNFSILSMAVNLGFAIGPAVGGFLINSAGYANLFLLSGMFALATFVVSIPVTEASYFRTKAKENFRPDSATLSYLTLTFIGFLVVGQDVQPFSLYASGFANQSALMIGILFSFSGLLIVGLQLAVAGFIRSRGTFPLVAASLVMGAVGYFVTGLSRDTPSLFVSMALITLTEILFVVPTQVWVTYKSPGTRKGAFQGYFSAVRYTGRSVAAWLGTTALGYFSFDPAIAWDVVVVISLVSLVLFYLHHKAYDA